MMNFLKRLFGKKQGVEPIRGHDTAQTEEQQSATRERMEAEIQVDRDRRSAVDPTAAPAADREQAVVVLVTRAFPGSDVQASTVDVMKLEGGTAATLRLTVDGTRSTDIEKARLEGDEPVETLAASIVEDLQRQA